MKKVIIVLFVLLVSIKSFGQSLTTETTNVDPKNYYSSVSDSTRLDSTKASVREIRLYNDNIRLSAVNKRNQERKGLHFTVAFIVGLLGFTSFMMNMK